MTTWRPETPWSPTRIEDAASNMLYFQRSLLLGIKRLPSPDLVVSMVDEYCEYGPVTDDERSGMVERLTAKFGPDGPLAFFIHPFKR